MLDKGRNANLPAAGLRDRAATVRNGCINSIWGVGTAKVLLREKWRREHHLDLH